MIPLIWPEDSMTRFVVGEDRSQSTLFPERLDDYLGEDNPVRAIDVFVDGLDLAGLGFGGVEPEATGRPAYHPATLLKIYVSPCCSHVSRLPVLRGHGHRPVRFELSEQTRQAIDDYLKAANKGPGEFLFTGRRGPETSMTTRQYARLTRRHRAVAGDACSFPAKLRRGGRRDHGWRVVRLPRQFVLRRTRSR
jgi:hypothetical protein